MFIQQEKGNPGFKPWTFKFKVYFTQSKIVCTASDKYKVQYNLHVLGTDNMNEMMKYLTFTESFIVLCPLLKHSQIISILHMRKLRHRKLTRLPRDHTAGKLGK